MRVAGLLALFLVAALAIGLAAPGDLRALAASFLGQVQQAGAGGILLFIAAYILACVFLLPGSILTLGAGFLYGVGRGFLIVSIASILGATAAFEIGRLWGRGWVQKRLEPFPRFRAMDRAVKRGGWKIVLLARLSPVLPFNLLNYAFGLTDIPLRDYFFASWIGMVPGTLLYVYLGSLAGNLADLSGSGRARGPWEWGFYGAGLLATAAAAFYVARLGKEALAKELQ